MTDRAKHPLTVATRLFATWQKANISYCHWKSNQHLLEALAGETDLDVLVLKKDSKTCEAKLTESGFKKIISPPWGRYLNVSDWIGFDTETGKLCHIHLHYDLVTGQKNVKNIHLPVESWLLTNTKNMSGVTIPEHEKELIILVVRVLIKTTLRQLMTAKLKKQPFYPSNIHHEFEWLLQRSNLEKLDSYLRETSLPIPPDVFRGFLQRLQTNSLDPLYVLRTKIKLLYSLKNYKRGTYLCAFGRKMWFMVLLKLISLFGTPRKKLFPHGGHYFAMVGCDGSGKSTLAGDLHKWLSWKIATRHVYFGIPKRSVLKMMIIICKAPFYFLSSQITIAKRVADFLEDSWWLYLAYHRNKLHKMCLRCKENGYIVIAERFPMQEFWNMADPIDGPRIKHPLMADLEKRIYKAITLPDKVHVLRVGINELRKRKSDLEYNIQKVKSEAVNAIPPHKNYHLIDGERPYPDVLIEMKNHIWRSI